MSFPRYPKYKDSGVEWLGEVPEHWEVISIKWLSAVKRGASPRPIDDPKYFDDEGEFAWVRIADVSACDGELLETSQRLSELGAALSVKIQPGELFVSIAGTVGKPCLSAIKACIHDGFVYFPDLQIDPKFLYRIFEGGTCYGGLGKWGTQLNLNTDTIGSIRIALPPTKELHQALAFLDRETAKIDGLVAEQRRLMELLKEKRQAVISHAVTKGLNPNAPMKDSGIEWLGEVPEHWEIGKLKRWIESVESGTSVNAADEPVNDDQIGVLKTSSVYSGQFDPSENKAVVREEIDRVSCPLRINSLIVSRMNTPDLVGAAGHVTEAPANLFLPDRLWQVTIGDAVPEFIYLWTRSNLYRGQIQSVCTGTSSSMKNLTQDQFGCLIVCIPPEYEQNEIVEAIKREAAKLDTLITEAQRAIDLLQERRTALISAAVTGQIDVRKEVEG